MKRILLTENQFKELIENIILEMYTYNNFIFGHDLSTNKELNNSIDEYIGGYETTINSKKFEIYSPYHGGQVRGDVLSVIFGINITDDDDNPNYIDEVKFSKKEDYIDDYNEFISKLKKDLNGDRKLGGVEYGEFVDELFEFLDNNEPNFYRVESSS